MRLVAAALAGLVGLVAGPALARAAPVITNPQGTGAVAEQVALVGAFNPDLFQAQFCSGTLRDALHVITAAHCVEAPMDTPSTFRVVAGVTNLHAPGAGMQQRGVSAISSFPGWDPTGSQGGDAALVTLDAPLALTASVTPLATLAEPTPGAVGFISGWGNLDPAAPNVFSDTLLFGLVEVLADASCRNYGAAYAAPTMVCAQGRTTSGAIVDACQGDSGGPLENVSSLAGGVATTDALIGIVSFGRSCGDPAFPGVYTEVGNPAIKSFLSQTTALQRPIATAPPAIATVGARLAAGTDVRCQPGTWTGAASFAYQFVRYPLVNGRPDLDHAAAAAAPSPAATYRLTAADVGHGIFCIVQAANAGGTRFAGSDGISPVAAAAPVPAATAPSTTRDVSAPTARFTRTHCVHRACTLRMLAADDRGLDGVRLSLRVTRVGRCSRACRRALRKTVLFQRKGTTGFAIYLPKLTPGRYRVRARAVDAAGNRQARWTTIVIRVR